MGASLIYNVLYGIAGIYILLSEHYQPSLLLSPRDHMIIEFKLT